MNDNAEFDKTTKSAASPPTVNEPLQAHQPKSKAIADLLQGLATPLLVALLIGLAWWGHQTGWAFPKFADLFGGSQSVKDDWCSEHAVPESECVECNRKLAPWITHYGFCEKHGVHNCPLEHPDAAQIEKSPDITQAEFDRAARGLAFKDWPENNPGCLKIHRIIQVASDEAFRKMNAGVGPVLEKPIVETVVASGELQFMPKGVAAASSAVAGRVWQVTAKGKLGARVNKGDVLAVIDAAEVGKARAELLQAYAQFESRKQFLDSATANSTALPVVKLMELHASFDEVLIRFKAAQQTLVNLGLPVDEAQVKSVTPAKLAEQLPLLGLPADVGQLLGMGNLTANLLPIRAPRDGIVTEAKVNEGETVETSKTLFVVADPTKLWLLLNVRQEDTRFLKVRGADSGGSTTNEGSTVLFKLPGSNAEFRGTLVWKGSVADEKTRAIQYAAEVPNDKQLLSACTFVTGRIVIREEKSAIVVPNDAVHWEGDCNIVFVRDKNWFLTGAPKLFHIRSVRPGVKTGSDTEIIAGLLPGEVVATTNSAALRAELLKNNLGAG